MARSQKDRTSSDGSAEGNIFSELIKRGWVTQRVDTVTYPRLSGTFSQRREYSSNDWEKRSWVLEMAPDSNNITGKYYAQEAHWTGPTGGKRKGNDVSGRQN